MGFLFLWDELLWSLWLAHPVPSKWSPPALEEERKKKKEKKEAGHKVLIYARYKVHPATEEQPEKRTSRESRTGFRWRVRVLKPP